MTEPTAADAPVVQDKEAHIRAILDSMVNLVNGPLVSAEAIARLLPKAKAAKPTLVWDTLLPEPAPQTMSRNRTPTP